MFRTNEPTTPPSPLEMLRSNESTTLLSPLIDLTPFPAVGDDQMKEGPSRLNNNLSPHFPLVSLNKESLGACNGVPPAHDPISTPAKHIPIVARDLSINGKPAQLNTTSKDNQHKEAPSNSSGSSTVLSCPPGNELSLAVVLYNPRNINSTPASIKEPPSPPTLLQPLHTNSLEPPSPVDTTEKTTSANPIDKILHARLAPYNLAPLTSTHLLKSNAELLQQLITFPEPCGQIAAPPILASKSHPSDAPGNILHPVSEELPVSDDAPGTVLTPLLALS
ncbi:hypothetical protein PCANC_19625 [Puccinia coronata f. sp. avenae]|uniref:Uncharacterized protein n=1 Tax=Puccinia coronata f. sp. avenae TaxID=200324 RepID=A0A2N5U0T9_9BASI|nr:hypothetical protein PCANC_19625 [Puccinia coronata f. sp. avenae]